ncbi:unnamed protein product [Penicillium nalgiovense]|nr:unnamed protein product [Penicillium nalgiovense]
MHLLQSKAATRLRTMLVTNLQSSLTVMMNKDRPSLMQRKFMQFFAEDDASEGHTSSQCWEPEPFRKQYSKVVGYHIKLWGPYPTLLTGPPLHPVDGLAYKVQSQEQLNRLSAYETSKYRIKACMIKFPSENGGEEERVRGIVFIWNGESENYGKGVSLLRNGWINVKNIYK